MEKALSRDAYERSDYGSVFGQFCRRHLDTVDGRTTILIIGDGRSNRLPPQLDSFQALAERARRVVERDLSDARDQKIKQIERNIYSI